MSNLSRWTMPVKRIALLLMLLAAVSHTLTAQQPVCSPARTALVLAGGGAKGAAHVGVIQAMDSLGIVPDFVVGTSIGSIVGALYASGYSGRQIDSLTAVYPVGTLFTTYEPRLPLSVGPGLFPLVVWQQNQNWVLQSGTVREEDVNALINALMLRGNLQARGDFDSLTIPYRAVATDLATRRTVVLDGGDLAQATRASFAIPLVFNPVLIDGRLLIDGGVSANVPVNIARALGATRVIVSVLHSNTPDTVQAGSSTRTVANKLVGFLFLQPPDSLNQNDVLVHSDVSQYGALDFAPNRVAELVEAGYRSAVEAFAGAPCRPHPRQRRVVSVPKRVSHLSIPSGRPIDDSTMLTRELGLSRQKLLRSDSIVSGIRRIAHEEEFAGVWLHPTATPTHPDAVILSPTVLDGPRRTIGVGLGYISTLGARLWVGGIDRSILGKHTRVTGLLDLSEYRQSLDLGIRRTGRIGSLTVYPTMRAMVGREVTRIYIPNAPAVASFEVTEASLLMGFERAFTGAWRYRWGAVARAWDARDRESGHAVGGRGMVFHTRTDGTLSFEADLEANTSYTRVSFDANIVRDIRRLSVIPRLRAGVGYDLPMYRTFVLGGLDGFAGTKVFEIRGTSMALASVLARYPIAGPFALRLEPQMGWISDEDKERETILGAGHGTIAGIRTGVEMRTPIGPFRVEYGINNRHRKQVGFIAGIWR